MCSDPNAKCVEVTGGGHTCPCKDGYRTVKGLCTGMSACHCYYGNKPMPTELQNSSDRLNGQIIFRHVLPFQVHTSNFLKTPIIGLLEKGWLPLQSIVSDVYKVIFVTMLANNMYNRSFFPCELV